MEKLTKKQRGFVKDYVETGNGVESALKNYDTEDYSTAGNIASDNLKKPKIVEVIESLAERISDDDLIQKHKQFLNSEREEIGIKALDMGYKLKGSYAAEKSININLNEKVIDPSNPKVLKLIQELRDANEQRDTN